MPLTGDPRAAFEAATDAAVAAGLPAPMKRWLPPLMRLYASHPVARRVSGDAVTGWHGATARRAEAATLDAPDAFDPRPYRASLVPLVQLPLRVRGIPTLGELFPAPLPGLAAPWAAAERAYEALPPMADEPAPWPQLAALGQVRAAAQGAAPAPDPEAAEASAEALRSRRRQAAVAAWLNDPAHPAFADRPTFFRLVAEEHELQLGQQRRAAAALAEAPGDEARGAALAEATELVELLTQVMRRVASGAG